MHADIRKVFENYPQEQRNSLLKIRQFIYDIATEIPGLGQVDESLKWGQPSYVSKSGTPIRLGLFEKDKVAVFFHCQTTLVSDFRSMFEGQLEFSKNRGIVLEPDEELPMDALKVCIGMALTYHMKKHKS